MPRGKLLKYQPEVRKALLRGIQEGRSYMDLAKAHGISRWSVAALAKKYEPTLDEASLRLRAGAATLAERVVNEADPKVAVDVLERLEVVPPRKGDGGLGFQVIVGVALPGCPPRCEDQHVIEVEVPHAVQEGEEGSEGG